MDFEFGVAGRRSAGEDYIPGNETGLIGSRYRKIAAEKLVLLSHKLTKSDLSFLTP